MPHSPPPHPIFDLLCKAVFFYRQTTSRPPPAHCFHPAKLLPITPTFCLHTATMPHSPPPHPFFLSATPSSATPLLPAPAHHHPLSASTPPQRLIHHRHTLFSLHNALIRPAHCFHPTPNSDLHHPTFHILASVTPHHTHFPHSTPSITSTTLTRHRIHFLTRHAQLRPIRPSPHRAHLQLLYTATPHSPLTTHFLSSHSHNVLIRPAHCFHPPQTPTSITPFSTLYTIHHDHHPHPTPRTLRTPAHPTPYF